MADHRDDAERQYTPESICALVAAAENVRLIWHALGLEDRRRMPFIGLVVSDLVIAYEHLESISQDATIAAKDVEIAALRAENERLHKTVDVYAAGSLAHIKETNPSLFAKIEALTPPQEPQG